MSELVYSGRFAKTGWYSIPNLGSFRSVVHSEPEPKTGRLLIRIIGKTNTGDPQIRILEVREIISQISLMAEICSPILQALLAISGIRRHGDTSLKHGTSEMTPLTLLKAPFCVTL